MRAIRPHLKHVPAFDPGRHRSRQPVTNAVPRPTTAKNLERRIPTPEASNFSMSVFGSHGSTFSWRVVA